MLETTKWLATLPGDNLERTEVCNDENSINRFNNHPEFKEWLHMRSSQFLWYIRESDSGVISHRVRRLWEDVNMHKQDLTYFFCAPSVTIPGESLERPVT